MAPVAATSSVPDLFAQLLNVEPEDVDAKLRGLYDAVFPKYTPRDVADGKVPTTDVHALKKNVSEPDGGFCQNLTSDAARTQNFEKCFL